MQSNGAAAPSLTAQLLHSRYVRVSDDLLLALRPPAHAGAPAPAPEQGTSDAPPPHQHHPSDLAVIAHRALIERHRSSTIVLAGPSGSGKSHAARLVLLELCRRLGPPGLLQRLLALRPALRALGGAATAAHADATQALASVALRVDATGACVGVGAAAR